MCAFGFKAINSALSLVQSFMPQVFDIPMSEEQESKSELDSKSKKFNKEALIESNVDNKRNREDISESCTLEDPITLLLDDPLEDEDEEYVEDEESLSSEDNYQDDDFTIVQEDIQNDMDPEYEDSPFDPIDTANILPEKRRHCTASTQCHQ